jgi:hypothetical protein
MTIGLRKLRTALPMLTVVTVIAAAAVVWHALPANTQIYAPFDVHGSVGEQVTGRALATTVHGVRVASVVTSPASALVGGRVGAAGRWVVVDATVQALTRSVSPKAELEVAGNTYLPSDRFPIDNLGAVVDPGIPQHGSWVFDVAANLIDGDTLRPFALRVGTADTWLESRLVITVKDVTRSDNIAITPPQVGG